MSALPQLIFQPRPAIAMTEPVLPRPTLLPPISGGIVGTPQQESFWQEVVHGKTHVILSARAGSGKSFSICHAASLSLQKRPNLRIGFCAYNKEISEDLKKKIPKGAECGTIYGARISRNPSSN